MALGARAADVVRIVLQRGVGLTVAGVGIGLPLAFGATRLLRSMLYGVSGVDPVTFVGIPLVLGAVAIAACWLPARRATRVDPVIALRSE
jgi:ABC-type antimicrobial peptide transport system permease subunit